MHYVVCEIACACMYLVLRVYKCIFNFLIMFVTQLFKALCMTDNIFIINWKCSINNNNKKKRYFFFSFLKSVSCSHYIFCLYVQYSNFFIPVKKRIIFFVSFFFSIRLMLWLFFLKSLQESTRWRKKSALNMIIFHNISLDNHKMIFYQFWKSHFFFLQYSLA